MPIGLEHVATGDGIQRNFEKLNSLVLDTGGITAGIRFGAGTVTFPGGSQDSSDATVTHGLGKTPVVVFTQSTSVTAMARPSAVGATTFTVKHRTLDGSAPANGTTQGFYWLAIG